MKFTLLSLAIAAIAITGCNQSPPPSFQKQTAQVSFITVQETPQKIESVLKGRVTAVDEAQVRPQITGIIQSVNVKDGQEVKKGQTLYKVDPAQYQAAYDQALAAYDSIKADLSTAKLKYERYSTLAKQKAVSIQDADEAKAVYLKLTASIEEKKAAVQLAKINLDYTEIKAPISGIIGITSLTPGALVTANQTEILNTITTLDPIYVDLAQPSHEFLDMKLLQKQQKTTTVPVELRFDTNSDYLIKGKVESNELLVNESTDSVKLRAVFDNKDKLLLPGMYAYANVIYGVNDKGIVIPSQSVLREVKGGSSVYVVTPENKIEKRTITILSNVKNDVLVSSGLAAGDKVVFEGIEKVKNGDDVIAEEKKGDI